MGWGLVGCGWVVMAGYGMVRSGTVWFGVVGCGKVVMVRSSSVQ